MARDSYNSGVPPRKSRVNNTLANERSLPESTLVGRGEGNNSGIEQKITLGPGLTMTGTELSATSGGGVSINIIMAHIAAY